MSTRENHDQHTALVNSDTTVRVSLTSSLPLVLIHLALAVGIDDLHVLQKRLEVLVLAVLGENLMELLHVGESETVFACEPAMAASESALRRPVYDKASLTLRSYPNRQHILVRPPRRPLDRTSTDGRIRSGDRARQNVSCTRYSRTRGSVRSSGRYRGDP